MAQEEFHSVVVIGAGISGMYAAQLLRRQYPDLLVVEAQDRIGGRIMQVSRHFPCLAWSPYQVGRLSTLGICTPPCFRSCMGWHPGQWSWAPSLFTDVTRPSFTTRNSWASRSASANGQTGWCLGVRPFCVRRRLALFPNLFKGRLSASCCAGPSVLLLGNAAGAEQHLAGGAAALCVHLGLEG